eukprot:14728021-Ditylum_brightwellii.AAC.1
MAGICSTIGRIFTTWHYFQLRGTYPPFPVFGTSHGSPNADLLWSCHQLISHLTTTFKCTLCYVKVDGHADHCQAWDSMSQPKQLNCLANKEAKAFLQRYQSHDKATTSIPFVGWHKSSLNPRMVMIPLCEALLHTVHKREAIAYLINKGLITSEMTKIINWPSLSWAQQDTP